ncbi:MAG: hypothetical protein HZA46_18010 [Planctomycetales bacterium]|nr:hypothetical protein [Planctomycetales bacterium]
MSRGIPQPWYRPSRSTWYVTVDGVQHNLYTDDKVEAFRRWHELIARAPEPPEAPDTTVVVLLASFLKWTEKHKKPATYEWHRNYLQSFVKAIPPELRVADMKPFHVTRWLDKQTTWGESSWRVAITTIKRALSWTVEEGYIDHSPIASIRKPKRQHRETILTEEQQRLIVAEAIDERFRDFVTLIQETGARPQEVRTVEARHVNLQNGLWIFPPTEHKTGEKTGEPRIIYLNAKALEFTQRLVEQHPTGPLCRNVQGRP